jgi:spermidine synthase
MSSDNGSQDADRSAIEIERAKSGFLYKEDVAPGLTMEMELKRILISTSSPYQKVDVVETYFGKTLVTDGKTQSTEFDEFAYHESLVHPSLLKVSNSGSAPKVVFIGGGGELATAREVLRHASVARVVMVDLDAKVVEVSEKYLPEWGGQSVLTDPRFELVIGDAYGYLLKTEEMFDVVIMDISDPIEAGPGVMLYTKEFYEHAVTRLNPNGVFVTQGGTAESIPSAVVKVHDIDPSCFAPIYNTLKAVFHCVVPYTTHIPSFGGDWGFIMAFNDDGNPATDQERAWKIPDEDAVNALVHKQITGGSDALKFYDGTTHLRMFALTKPLRNYMAQDERIMTRENPIFMY